MSTSCTCRAKAHLIYSTPATCFGLLRLRLKSKYFIYHRHNFTSLKEHACSTVSKCVVFCAGGRQFSVTPTSVQTFL